MEEKYIKFYKTFHKKFKNNENLIHCSNLVSNGGVSSNRELDRIIYVQTHHST
jgi:bisphosphoglycerate-independent phosphoglycerate mutase (AlkP superfamily)